jgi:hypothetical protein
MAFLIPYLRNREDTVMIATGSWGMGPGRSMRLATKNKAI